MAVFKCKMCGGELDVREGMSVAECPYCGTKQTLPRLDNDKKINLYDRADHFRRNNEYDKAADIYEKILEEDKEDSEAYWSLLLCHYGVEYVEDPKTHKRVPTINRAQYTSVFLDEDYQKAIEYADGYQKDVYQEEAKTIDDIQKGILEISNKEEPFDVFICYKETDEQGRRTYDSVYAQDIYNNLTNEGYKVFFSRITLEDKLGTAYEPYIFAALNSAKIMIVVGTNANNFNAVWVKNEWSRYLSLVKKGEDKTIIPVYRDMNPYDLPEEFAYLQAQDMNKVGFIQDLIRNIKKIISEDVIDERQKKGTSTVIIDTMMRRATDALAKREWDTAARCYDSVLDYDSQNFDAYLGKLMVDYKVKDQDKLAEGLVPLEKNNNYKEAIRLADEKTKNSLIEYNITIKNKLKIKKKRKFVLVFCILVLATVFATGYICKPYLIYNKAINIRDNSSTIAAGGINTFGIKSNGSVMVTYGNTGIKGLDNLKDIVSISASSYQVACLKSDGTVEVLSDYDNRKINTENWTDIISVSVGTSHIVGLKTDGTIVATGSNSFKQCDVSEWNDIICVSAGDNFTIGLKSNGTLVSTGNNNFGQCNVSEWKNIIAISTGTNHTVGLKLNGKLMATGNNSFGQCDINEWNNIISVSAGNNYTVGLKSDGTVVAIGNNDYNQCGVSNWSDIISISAGLDHTVGLKSNGTAVAVGNNLNKQCEVDNFKDIKTEADK